MAAAEQATAPELAPEPEMALRDLGSEGKDGGKEEDEEEGKGPTFDWMPAGCTPMADGEYDVVVMGTGFTECLLSGLLCVLGMKVLVVDRNNYYGGDSASLNLTNLYKKFNDGNAPAEDFFASLSGDKGPARDRDYNVDLIPKLIMAHGNLIKILLHTKVTRYLDFKAIDGSYVQKGGKAHKVPTTGKEVLNSPLMGMFEKRRFRNFLIYVNDYDANNASTHKGRNLNTMTAAQLFGDFGLDAYTQEFVGHAMALYTDEQYLAQPAAKLVEDIQLYVESMMAYEDTPSPYLYPMYGLGALPEAFSRLAAIHGGVFMLNRGVDEILFNEDGTAWGIRGDNEVAKATMFIGDPSYFPAEKVRPTGKVIRSICLLNHIPAALAKEKVESAQIIIPGSQVGRANDIYVVVMGSKLEVVAAGIVAVIVSTRLEGHDNPLAEVEPGIALLGDIVQRFDSVADLLEPVEDGLADKCFISKSYDDTSHFKSAADDVLDLYKRVTGNELDMSISADITKDY